MDIVADVDWSASVEVGGPLRRLTAAAAAGIQWRGITVAADARIDNADELRSELGADAADSSDVLLGRAYLAWGASFPDHLRGDFAVVVWDERQRQLVAARDPFGVRPLVYRAADRCLWIRSHVAPMLAALGQKRPVLDDGMIVEHLLWRYRAADATFFRDIRQVPPGHTVVATPGGLEVRRYWLPQRKLDLNLTTAECHSEFRRLFFQSVRRRSRSTASIVVHVSGGLDSSSIAVTVETLRRAGTLLAPDVLGVTASYPGLACDERPFSDAVARAVSFPVERWDATRPEALDLTAPGVECPDGRAAQISGVDGDIALTRRQGAGVILSGVGGDQLASVSGVVQDMVAGGNWRGAIRELIFFPGATAASRIARMRFVGRRYLPTALRDIVTWSRARPPNWLGEQFEPLARQLAMPGTDGLSFVSHVQTDRYRDITSQQVIRAVEAMQRQALPQGVEFRFPFLDLDLVNFVLSIPYQHWPAPGPYARLHREALANLLPPEIVARRTKTEFTPALMNRVFYARLEIERLISQDVWVSGQYVHRDRARRFIEGAFASSDADASGDWRQVWAIATLEAWMRAVLRYHPPPIGRTGEWRTKIK
jgi:asparagine synthase (glutamine-hydrolysing)